MLADTFTDNTLFIESSSFIAMVGHAQNQLAQPLYCFGHMREWKGNTGFNQRH